MLTTSSEEINLRNNFRFKYTVHPFEMKNSLGKVIALLSEYVITRCDVGIDEPVPYKLYKTKEGNWYEPESEIGKPDKIIRELKSAINSLESDL